ncbi:MAG: phosphoribosylanthranilate isomerase [Methylococcaceae bacterium]|nr:phosphoribosylanthranilate isomerase [Methylococcaceae bacterium]
MRTRIKICGFTQVKNAVEAAHLGVDAIGLVFYPPSPRNVSIEQAVNIVNALPAFVTVVALFVDAQEAQIRDILSKVSIDCLQFHGDETVEACRLYKKPYMKAVRMKPGLDVMALAEEYNDASALLLDAYHPGIKGGSGSQFDWELIPAQCPLPVVLAGGLQVDNARQAVETVRPYALDVSSGVESSKGIKDVAKMAAFIQAIKEGDR